MQVLWGCSRCYNRLAVLLGRLTPRAVLRCGRRAFYSGEPDGGAWARGTSAGLAAATRKSPASCCSSRSPCSYIYGRVTTARPGRGRGRLPDARRKNPPAALGWDGLVPPRAARPFAYGIVAAPSTTRSTAGRRQESYFGPPFQGPFSGVVLGAIKPFPGHRHTGCWAAAVNKGRGAVRRSAGRRARGVRRQCWRRCGGPTAPTACGLVGPRRLSGPPHGTPARSTVRSATSRRLPDFPRSPCGWRGSARGSRSVRHGLPALAGAYCSVRFPAPGDGWA